MNLKTSEIDDMLFWIAWAFVWGFVIQALTNNRLNGLIVGALVLSARALMWSTQKMIEVYIKPKIQEQ